MKIAVIGYSGSGKSTLSKRLSEKYKCPLLYLDTVNFEADWKERDRDEARKIVKEFMKNDSWVIDGNYRAFYQDERFEEADKIIFLNFPRRICFYRAFKRFLYYKNKVRESAANGCCEKFDFEFMKWILIDGRSKKYRDHYNYICIKYADKISLYSNSNEVLKDFPYEN